MTTSETARWSGAVKRAVARRAARVPRCVAAIVVALSGLALGPAATATAMVYWADVNAGTIGRAALDGTGVERSFVTGAALPCGVAVDGAGVFWANNQGLDGTPVGTTIGRADLAGFDVDQEFIAGAFLPCGVAVDDRHVYWANTVRSTIGRANLDGSGVDEDFIRDAAFPCGVAVDDTRVYRGNAGQRGVDRPCASRRDSG